MNMNEQYEPIQLENEVPEKKEPPVGEAVKTMIFGILSLQFSCAPILSILGIIFGALAKKWASSIIDNYPYTGARLFAKAGHITGKIGVILGIIFTVFWAIYFTVLFGVLIAGVVSGVTNEVVFY